MSMSASIAAHIAGRLLGGHEGVRSPRSGGSEAAPKPRYEASIASAFCGLQRRLLVPTNAIRVGPALQEIGGRRLLRASAGVPEGTRDLFARWRRLIVPPRGAERACPAPPLPRRRLRTALDEA